jgi:hypothetical protein
VASRTPERCNATRPEVESEHSAQKTDAMAAGADMQHAGGAPVGYVKPDDGRPRH